MSHSKAIIITCCVAIIWSLAGLNIKLIVWPFYAIAAGRCLIAIVLLTPLLLKHIAMSRKQGKTIIDKNVIYCACCFAIFNYCFITSTKLTTSVIAIMMQYTAPIYVAVISYFLLKEQITKIDIGVILAVAVGMILFFLDSSGSGSLLGNVIAIFNGISFAGVSIFLRLQKNGDPMISMYLGNAIAGILGIPFVINAGVPDFNSCIFLLVAGISVAVTYTLYANASKSLSALETVLLPIVDPVLNPVWVFFFLGEQPGILSILGSILILISVTGKIVHSLKR
jgi:drug/metabolite transporter (DMT)-like permease